MWRSCSYSSPSILPPRLASLTCIYDPSSPNRGVSLPYPEHTYIITLEVFVLQSTITLIVPCGSTFITLKVFMFQSITTLTAPCAIHLLPHWQFFSAGPSYLFDYWFSRLRVLDWHHMTTAPNVKSVLFRVCVCVLTDITRGAPQIACVEFDPRWVSFYPLRLANDRYA